MPAPIPHRPAVPSRPAPSRPVEPRSAGPRSAPLRPIPGRRPRRPLPLGVAIAATALTIAALLVGGLGVPQLAGRPPGAAATPAESTVGAAPSTAVGSPAAPSSTPSVPAAPSARPSPSPRPVLRLAGAVPQRGTGNFVVGRDTGPVLGRSGTLRRFHVAVERGSGEDVGAFAAVVESALGDRRSWTGDGRTRLRRVPAGAPADFTVYLATAPTAARMCRAGGIDIRIGGRPYTSCRLGGRVVLNLDRWRLSVPGYVAAGVPLETYRHYLVNHEVGHELGHGHEGCPRPGRPAPVMVQQTLDLRGCTPYPWPRLDGRRYTGPRM